MQSCMVLQKYLSRMIKGALVCGIFAAIFRGQSSNNSTVHEIYEYIIKVRCVSCHNLDLAYLPTQQWKQ